MVLYTLLEGIVYKTTSAARHNIHTKNVTIIRLRASSYPSVIRDTRISTEERRGVSRHNVLQTNRISDTMHIIEIIAALCFGCHFHVAMYVLHIVAAQVVPL